MDPLIKSPEQPLDEDDGLYGYTAAELEELLREGEESGICEQPFEEIFDELFEKHFGRKPTLEERSIDPPSQEGL